MNPAPATPSSRFPGLAWILIAAVLGIGARVLIAPPVAPPTHSAPAVADPKAAATQHSVEVVSAAPALCYTNGSNDLRASLEQIFHDYPGDFDDSRVYLLARSLTEEQRLQLPAVIAEYFAKRDRAWVAKNLLQGWAEADGMAAMEHLTKQLPQQAKPGLLGDVLAAWARSQPDAASAWLDARPLSAITAKLRASYLIGISETDPAKALSMAREKGWLTGDCLLANGIFANWAVKDFPAAWAAISAAKAEGSNTLQWEHFSIGNARFTEAEFLNFAKGLNGKADGFNGALEFLNSYHAYRFPSAIKTHAGEFLMLDGGEKLVMAAARGMPLHSVLDLIPESTAPRKLSSIVHSSLQDRTASLDAADVERIQQLMASLSPGEQKTLATGAAMRCASSCPQAVASFWDKFDPKTQASYAEAIFDSLSKHDPAEAGRLYADLTDPAAKLKAYPRIQAAAARQDGPGALTKVLLEPDAALRSTAAGMAYAVWASAHTQEAIQHLEANADSYDLKALQAGALQSGSINSPGSSSSTSVGFDVESLMPVLKRLQSARQAEN